MDEPKYMYNGKDISLNIYIQIRDVIDIIKEKNVSSFEDALLAFYSSQTYKILQNTENALWAESAGYIADQYFEEIAESKSQSS